MSEIEQMLRSAAAAADWPQTPDLALAVVPRLEGVTPRQTGDIRRFLCQDMDDTAPVADSWSRLGSLVGMNVAGVAQ